MTTTLAPSRAFRTWRDRIDSGTFTRSQAQAWANTAGYLLAGETPRKRCNLTAEEAMRLADMLGSTPVALDSADTARGLDWLTRHGRWLADRMGAVDSFPVAELASFDRFTFDGSAEVDDSGGIHGARWAVPVWTVHLTDGRTLRYWWRTTWREDSMAGFSRPGGGFGDWWTV